MIEACILHFVSLSSNATRMPFSKVHQIVAFLGLGPMVECCPPGHLRTANALQFVGKIGRDAWAWWLPGQAGWMFLNASATRSFLGAIVAEWHRKLK